MSVAAQLLSEFQHEKAESWKNAPLSKDEEFGIVNSITSPLNLFIKFKDLIDEKLTINFVIYSLGENRIVAHGIYNRLTRQFEIENDDVCIYGSPGGQISKILPYLYRKGYKYVSNTVKDSSILLLKKDSVVHFPLLYQFYKQVLYYLEHDIPFPSEIQKQFYEKFSEATGFDDMDLINDEEEYKEQYHGFIENLVQFVNKYEEDVNRMDAIKEKDLFRDFNIEQEKKDQVYNELSMINHDFKEFVNHGMRFYNPNIYGKLNRCPTEVECEFAAVSSEDYNANCSLYE